MTNNGPANPRYEVQTRSGLSWGWYCGNDELSVAFAKARDAKRTGYTTRVRDSRANKVIPVPR